MALGNGNKVTPGFDKLHDIRVKENPQKHVSTTKWVFLDTCILEVSFILRVYSSRIKMKDFLVVPFKYS